MNKKGFSLVLIIVLVGALLGVGIYFLVREGRMDTDTPDKEEYQTPSAGGENGGDNGADNPPVQTESIKVFSPLPNALVGNSLTVTGEARGSWFFEASFPIKILDANGRELGVHYVEALTDWMTTSFVPFRGTVNISLPTTATGVLVLEKANPSGLPEHAGEVRAPIRFEQGNIQTRNIQLYFYNENKDRNSSGDILCSAQGLVAVARTIPLTNTPIQDAIRELLKGPTQGERLQVPNTEFPLAGVSLTGANLSNGVLTLSFNDPQNRTGGGSCRVQILRAMIEATAKQFGGVNTVRYQPIGVFEP